MNPSVIKLANMPWRQTESNYRVKAITRNDQRMRLIEFQRGFKEVGWCENAHVGFILKGAINLEFPNETIRVEAGDAIWIGGGCETRHRVHVIGKAATLIVFEEPFCRAPKVNPVEALNCEKGRI